MPKHVFAAEFHVAETRRRIYEVHVKLRPEPEAHEHVETVYHLVGVYHIHSGLLLQELEVRHLFLQGSAVEVLFTELQSVKSEFPVHGIEELETEVRVATVNELLDYLVNLEDCLVVRHGAPGSFIESFQSLLENYFDLVEEIILIL